MLVDLCVGEFVRRLAGGDPTPGGGSASALAGAMGAALVAMYCNLTAGRKRFAAVQDYMEQTAAFAQGRQEDLLKLVDRDSAAYEKIVTANRLPKETEHQRARRREATEVATLEATRTPLETAAVSTALLERIPPLAAKGNPNALSDLQVGMELLFTAFTGAKANVEINLPWLNGELKKQIHEELGALVLRAETAVAAMRAEIFRLKA